MKPYPQVKRRGEEMKPLIYVMSPYTKGDPCINTFCQIKMFNELLDDGLVTPYIPLVTHFLHTCHPRPYEDWIEYDKELLRVFDGGLRIDAKYGDDYLVTESSGADGEVQYFLDTFKPVFYNKMEMYKYYFHYKIDY